MWGQSKEEINSKLQTLGRGFAKIDLDAIENNMRQMHKGLKPGTKMMGVIKTNAYGHGAVQVGKILEELDFVFGYAVASYEEATDLRKAGLTKPILILGYTFPYCYDKLQELGIRPAVFREDMVGELDSSMASLGRGDKLKIHVKVDTGMGRIGIRPDDSGIEFLKKILATDNLEIEGIFTHFAKADEADKTSVNNQIKKFRSFCDRIKNELGLDIPIKHCSNSAGIVELNEANMDMVRAGITLYGLMPSDEVVMGDMKLKPVMSLYSHISYIKTLHAGESVSYGGVFTADKDTTVATVPVGYGDGYPRMLTGKGSVFVNGKKCPIIGRICMDQFMIDVSNVPSVKMGDEVMLLGGEGYTSIDSFEASESRITAEEIGKLSGRFNYELACLISDRIPRVYYYHGEPVFVKEAGWR